MDSRFEDERVRAGVVYIIIRVPRYICVVSSNTQPLYVTLEKMGAWVGTAFSQE